MSSPSSAIAGQRDDTTQPSLPPTQPIETPPGFPPALIGRALHTIEFFHAFHAVLVPGQENEAESHSEQGEDNDEAGVAGKPLVGKFLEALTATDDLQAFGYVCKHLAVLLNCLHRHAHDPKPDKDEEELHNRNRRGDEEDEENEEQGNDNEAYLRPKKRFITELARMALLQGSSSDNADRYRKVGNALREMDLLATRLKSEDYHQLSTQRRLVLFEGLIGCLMKLREFRELRPRVCMQPLGRLNSGADIWWLRSAPDCLIVETPTSTPTTPPQTAASTSAASSHEELQAGSGGGPETWQCYIKQEDLEQLRQYLQSHLSKSYLELVATIDRILLSRSRQQRRLSQLNEADVPRGRGTIGDYLRAKFISRLIGWAELLHKELPSGGCISPHRLRHYLVGSTKPSELADCLLQFENRLKSSIRIHSEDMKQWRCDVFECVTLAGLNFHLRQLLVFNQRLETQLGHRRGVCAICKEPVEARPVFCHDCCFNYHRECALNTGATAMANAASTSAVQPAIINSLWLCNECQMTRVVAARAKIADNEAPADDANARGSRRPEDSDHPPPPPTPTTTPMTTPPGSPMANQLVNSEATSASDETEAVNAGNTNNSAQQLNSLAIASWSIENEAKEIDSIGSKGLPAANPLTTAGNLLAQRAHPSEDVTDETIDDEVFDYQATDTETIVDDAIVDEAIVDEAIADEAIADEAIANEAITNEAINDEAIADEAITGDEAIDDEAINDEAIDNEAIDDEAIDDEAIDRAIVNNAIANEAINDEAIEHEAMDVDAYSSAPTPTMTPTQTPPPASPTPNSAVNEPADSVNGAANMASDSAQQPDTVRRPDAAAFNAGNSNDSTAEDSDDDETPAKRLRLILATMAAAVSRVAADTEHNQVDRF